MSDLNSELAFWREARIIYAEGGNRYMAAEAADRLLELWEGLGHVCKPGIISVVGEEESHGSQASDM